MSKKRKASGPLEEPNRSRIARTSEESSSVPPPEKEEGLIVHEDPYSDEFEEENIYEDGDDEEDDDENVEMLDEEEEDEEDGASKTKLWLPTDPLQPGQKLEYDNSAYDMIHFVTLDWPCLSFDVVPDNLGQQRNKYPHTIYIAAGTQAEPGSSHNSLLYIKFSDLNKTNKDHIENDGEFNLEGSDDEESSGYDDDPILNEKVIPIEDAVNRIRVMPQEPGIVATLLSNGQFQLIDGKAYLERLDNPLTAKLIPKKLVTHSFSTEGWALAWSHKSNVSVYVGNCDSQIYRWQYNQANWAFDNVAFEGHTDSVEDIQCSPSEGEVFASCSVDKTIKLWDSRKGKSAVASIQAHDSDVNVISWNSKRAFLLASGSDDGNYRVWDLRNLSSTEYKPLFSFNWHSKAITSIEWDPNDDSGLALSSEDNSVSLWDLSLTEEKTVLNGREIPSQLLFIHQGQENIKEVHWHKQIPGVVISTAQSGINIFKPALK